ncbi:class I SAM-dependent methyltransferase [Geitlerinema sp. PCC 9228]|jgi:SAM-dependent methyltransferase|uniref:class I SAM-dependent methyltransferase n=1 Tax=Geitlerinema sp. PCC 9228 TaxID=111611 RepID=UPI0008F9A4B3|nr:class I SAM-dependent methyltransferase [Geitlerinema sp. PCC 9228]
MSNANSSVSAILDSTQTHVGEITSQVHLSQKFRATNNRLNGISLLVATYCQQIDATVYVTIWNRDRTEKLRQISQSTRSFADNSWQSFYFDPILDSNNKIYWFDITSDSLPGNAITLWTNHNFTDICWRNQDPLAAAICFSCCYRQATAYQLDGFLFPHKEHKPSIDLETEEKLHRILWECVARKGLYFLRLAHLADGLGKTEGVEKILSVGCGEAYQESFLAGRLPQVRIDATDISIAESQVNRNSFANLQFYERDILQIDPTPEYDLVMSIECLEHIQNYERAFQQMAAKVKPGKYLYISVPFASKQEQQDPDLCQQEWENFQHYLPGFAFADLYRLFADNGFRVLQATNMFHVSVQGNINRWLSVMDTANIEPALPEILNLFLFDITNQQYTCRRDGVLGIRFLGQKITASDYQAAV